MESTECTANWIKENDSRLKKEHVIVHFNDLIKKHGFAPGELLEKYDISFDELNKKHKSEYLINTYYSFSEEIYNNIIKGLEKNYRSEMINNIGNCGRCEMIKVTLKVLKPTRCELLLVAKTIVLAGHDVTYGLFDDEYKITKNEALDHCLFHSAAYEGFLTMLKVLNKRHRIDREYVVASNNTLLSGAARKGRLGVVQWLTKKFTLMKSNILDHNMRVLIMSANTGQLKMLEWLVEHFKIERDDILPNLDDLIQSVAEGGQLKILQWITDKFKVTREDILMGGTKGFQFAADNGHLKVLQWLTEHFELVKKDIMGNGFYAFHGAVEGGHFDTVEWMVNHFKLTREDVEICLKCAMEDAKDNGYDKVYFWLIEKFNANGETLKIFLNVAKLIPRMPLEMRAQTFTIAFGSDFVSGNREIKTVIDILIAKGEFLCTPDTMDANILKMIAGAYDFKNKTRDEVTEILRKICKYEVSPLDRNLKYLTDENIIPAKDTKPQLTVEEARKALPGYIVAKPEELVKHLNTFA